MHPLILVIGNKVNRINCNTSALFSTDSNNMQLNALIGENLEELGIQKHSGPRFAAYTTVEARLKSFTNWPARLKQTPRAMAEAGFFYLGNILVLHLLVTGH